MIFFTQTVVSFVFIYVLSIANHLFSMNSIFDSSLQLFLDGFCFWPKFRFHSLFFSNFENFFFFWGGGGAVAVPALQFGPRPTRRRFGEDAGLQRRAHRRPRDPRQQHQPTDHQVESKSRPPPSETLSDWWLAARPMGSHQVNILTSSPAHIKTL